MNDTKGSSFSQKAIALKEPTLGKVLPVQIITMLISVTAMFIDSLMIGFFLKDDALAAYGLTTPVTLFITAFGGMISNGVQVMAGESAGAGDKEKLNRILASSIFASLIGSLIALFVTISFSSQMAVLLGANEDLLIGYTSEYLLGIAFCFPMIVLVLVIPTFLQLNGSRIDLVISAFLLIILDVAFDLLNIYVFHGGMLGMALASTFSYFISAAFLFTRFFMRGSYSFSFSFVSGKIIRDIFRFGMLYLTYKLCQVLLSLMINRILSEKGGSAYIAANSIISSVNLVIGAFPSGFGSTTTMMSSYYYGMGDSLRFRNFLNKIIKLSIIVDLIIFIGTVIFAPRMARAFEPRSQLVFETAVFGLRAHAASLIFNTVNYIMKNSSQSVRNTKRAYLICFLNDLALPLAAAFLITAFLQLSWIWLCYLPGQACTMVIILIAVIREKGEWSLEWK